MKIKYLFPDWLLLGLCRLLLFLGLLDAVRDPLVEAEEPATAARPAHLLGRDAAAPAARAPHHEGRPGGRESLAFVVLGF